MEILLLLLLSVASNQFYAYNEIILNVNGEVYGGAQEKWTN